MNVAPILIVDRSPDDIERARTFFEDHRIANPIDTAMSGADALAYLDGDAALPALILLELGDLGDMSGNELLSRLRADARTEPIPVVALGGIADTAPARVDGRREPPALLTKPARAHLAEFVRAVDLQLLLVSAPVPARASEAT